jgi:hypothetical protein
MLCLTIVKSREKTMRAVLLASLLIVAGAANAQEGERLSGTNLDFRTTLFFRVGDAKVQKLLPSGWELNSPDTGPASGMNLAVILVDNLMSHNADGKPIPTHRGAILLIPVKKAGAKTGGVMIFSGLMSEGNSPGAYGLYAPARTSMETKTSAGLDGNAVIEESWSISGDNGDSIKAVFHYARGALSKIDRDVIANGANKPDAYRIYRYNSASDTVKSVPLGIDRTSKLEFRASGPYLGSIFDGSQRLLAVISTPLYSRQVLVPMAR